MGKSVSGPECKDEINTSPSYINSFRVLLGDMSKCEGDIHRDNTFSYTRKILAEPQL
jgi:hypothetical protein